MNKPVRKLKINFVDLEFAFDSSSPELSSFLDLETGEVITTTSETDLELEQLYQEYDDQKKGSLDLPALLEALDYPDWQKDELIKADQVEQGFGERYIRIPATESHESWQDMQEFIYTMNNPRLQEHLERAIHGRGAFRAFKDTLGGFSKERERWFQFKADRARQRVLDWLEAEGIELVEAE